MSENNELGWKLGPVDTSQLRTADGWFQHATEHPSSGWTAATEVEVFAHGPETGAAGRRAAENALVDAGVITRAEADGLIATEINEQPDESLPGSVGMTPSELGAWVARNFECPECCDSGCSECKGAMFPPPGYSARDCDMCGFRVWIVDGETTCGDCLSEWAAELLTGEASDD